MMTLTRRIKRVMSRQVETKWKFSTTGPTNSSLFSFGVPFVAGLSNIDLGDDHTTRIANRIRLTSLEFDTKSFLQTANAGFAAAAVIRIILFYDKMNNGVNFTTLTAAQQCALLFGDPSTGNAYQSPLNPINWGSRFTMIKDKSYSLRTTGGATDEPDIKRMKWKLRLKTQVVYNDGLVVSPVQIQKNCLYMFMTTDVGALTLAQQPDIAVSYMIKWKDA